MSIPIPQSFVRLEKSRTTTSIAKRVRPLVTENNTAVVTLYSGMALPTAIAMQGGDPSRYRELWNQNKLGSVYDVENGTPLVVPKVSLQEDFSVHPYA